MAKFFKIRVPEYVPESPRDWARAVWDTYGFDYDIERSADFILAWAIDISDEELAENLEHDEIEFSTFEIPDEDLDKFFGI